MKVELSLHGLRLKNVAGVGKGTSDPFAVVTQLATTKGDKPIVLGKTEVIKNNLNPQWVKVFVIDYELGNPCLVAVSIFDEVRKGENKSMGSTTFDIGELLGARGNTKAKKLKAGGTLFAAVRKAQGSGLLRLGLKGSNLKNVEGMLSKSDPFFELSRKTESAGGQTWDNVYRSKEIRNTLDPAWETAVVELSILCGGDLDLPILITVFDHESSGKHKPMGKVEMSVKGMQMAAASGEPVKLMQAGKNVGMLHITKADVTGVADMTDRMEPASVSAPAPASHTPSAPAVVGTPNGIAAASVSTPASYARSAPAVVGTPNFIDYVTGGCELNVVIAVDFTGSNGDPRVPGTLHHMDDHSFNDYEKAISSIVSILDKYDSDQMFPVLGFGAKYGGVVRHCFQCGSTAEVKGVAGVLEAYNQVFRSGLIMSGPTVFEEVLQTAAARAQSSLQAAQQRGLQTYTILLIITDGAVSDPSATARCLNAISDSPLSVVIVGVGNADFSSMQFLDDSAAPGKRDVAQFVQFNKHSASSVALTSETLHEVPDQLVKYFQKKGIQPMPAMQRTDSTVSIGVEEEEVDLSLDIGEEEIVVTGGGNDFVDGFAASRYKR